MRSMILVLAVSSNDAGFCLLPILPIAALSINTGMRHCYRGVKKNSNTGNYPMLKVVFSFFFESVTAFRNAVSKEVNV